MIISVILFIIIFILYGIYNYIFWFRTKNISSIIKNDNMLVVEIISNNNKLFALLDTGSDCSYINENSLNFLLHKDITVTNDIIIDNSSIKNLENKCDVFFSINKHNFRNTFFIHDLKTVSNVYNKGIDVILGNDFFIENKMNINLHNFTLEKFR